MVTKKDAENLLGQAVETRNRIRTMIIDILVELNATSESNGVVFDAENGQAPSLFSINCLADADGIDVYIMRLWLDNDKLKANYYVPSAEFSCDEVEVNMPLDDETCVNYEDILDWLKEKLDK